MLATWTYRVYLGAEGPLSARQGSVRGWVSFFHCYEILFDRLRLKGVFGWVCGQQTVGDPFMHYAYIVYSGRNVIVV